MMTESRTLTRSHFLFVDVPRETHPIETSNCHLFNRLG